jgi:hypothetical protein
MTDKEALVLSRIAYIDFKDDKGGDATKKYLKKTLLELAQDFYVDPKSGKPLNDFGEWGALSNTEQNEMLGDILKGKYPHLSNLVLQDFTNQNDSNGLVAYAFCDKSNPQNKIFAFRGTEGSQLTASGLRSTIGFVLKDYIDNYYTGTKRVSLQFDPAKAFVDKNMADGTEIFVTGHSKGGGIASYIASTRAGVQGKAFDGPGVGQCLTPAQKATLSNNTSFVNYVLIQAVLLFLVTDLLYQRDGNLGGNSGDSIFNYFVFGFGPLFAGRSNRSNSSSKRSTNDTSPSGRPLRSCFFSKAKSSSSVKVRKLCQPFTVSNSGLTFTS